MQYATRAEVEAIGRAGARVVQDEHGTRARYLSSYWLYLEENDQAFTPHFRDGFWEAWVTKWMSNQFDKHYSFLDIGANVGYYGLMAAKAGLETVMFEPNRDLVPLLRNAQAVNRVSGPVFPFALSDREGVTTFGIPEGHSGGGSIGGTDGKIVEVDTRPLDKFAFEEWYKPLIKIDAEGAEPLIWDGMQEFLAEHSGWCITLEWVGSRYDAKSFADKLYDACIVGVIDDNGAEQIVSKEWLLASPDWHMVVVRKRP